MNIYFDFPRAREKNIPIKQSTPNTPKAIRIEVINASWFDGLISTFPIKMEKIIMAIPMLDICPTSRIVPKVPEAIP